ncbi:hypothetical protein EAL2_c01140 [Peptoclostridium acidaminophilum DSM 3953]|uniref:Uncharacterized protein n=1 Tax=Peptoclostridium acidaminophilum DSM 3953 TaxID=1286171 RepID=W8TCB5_PEPAC|nr:hypothetical protein EAL2_c01140 [Peptoclostridium acidaminophilum DSM 3953]
MKGKPKAESAPVYHAESVEEPESSSSSAALKASGEMTG